MVPSARLEIKARQKVEAEGPAFSIPAGSRLIPACAGKTWLRSSRSAILPAHPHVCGENAAHNPCPSWTTGSSPRVRGKLWAYTVEHLLVRLIPACAGKTHAKRSGSKRSKAHPRVCGENFTGNLTSQSIEGSSPRVRGKRGFCFCNSSTKGLIPACAGKTKGFVVALEVRGLIPACAGKTDCEGLLEPLMRGSSPRVRGKLKLSGVTKRSPGLIPACAGKTTFGNSFH